jgi:hypothetical protein
MGSVSTDWLQQLAPAHAPPPPGWWPPAPGWWGLALLLLIAVVLPLLWLRRPAQRQRRAALRELRLLEASAGDDASLARGLEHLLRRFAIARFGREPVARLSGEHWIAFVAAHGGAALAGEPGRELLRAAYGGSANASRAQWLNGARGFVRGIPWAQRLRGRT